jgi:hypothetical protein
MLLVVALRVKHSFGGVEQPDHKEEEELDWTAEKQPKRGRFFLRN